MIFFLDSSPLQDRRNSLSLGRVLRSLSALGIVFWFSTLQDWLDNTCGIIDVRNPRYWRQCFLLILFDCRTSWNMYPRESLRSSCVQTSWPERDTRGRPFSISVSFSMVVTFVLYWQINTVHHILFQFYFCSPRSALVLCLSWLRGRKDCISTNLSVWTWL